MKIDTPQILWHNGTDNNGKPAPLYSVSILPNHPSKPSSSELERSPDIELLATAGNTPELHLWKLSTSNNPNNNNIKPSPTTNSNNLKPSKPSKILHASKQPAIVHHLTLSSRHERSINAISFSPKGTHLVAAGDGGSLVIYTVPSPYHASPNSSPMRGGGRVATKTPNYFWNQVLENEKDLQFKIVPTHATDIMDVSWSEDERRVMVGSLDHSILVFEATFCSSNTGTSSLGLGAGLGEGVVHRSVNWNCVYRNTKEHSHYVQGVAFDPLGTYLASQGSDRTVRVWSRKKTMSSTGNGNSTNTSNGTNQNKKVLSSVDKNANATSTNGQGDSSTTLPTSRKSNGVGGKFEIQSKAQILKYRSESTPKDKDAATNANSNSHATTTITSSKKQHLFADEGTVNSFFRRLAWTSDGAFLITPASLWQKKQNIANGDNMGGEHGIENNMTSLEPPTFATYLFARHHYDQPYQVLFGLDKPSVVVRANPVLFQLPPDVKTSSKENIQNTSVPTQSGKPPSQTNTHHWKHVVASTRTSTNTSSNAGQEDSPSPLILPYRSIFAVLTLDTILIYDTHHTRPLCIARGLHYAGLTDCSWSSNGRNLVVSSTDGYISILSFEEGELGQVYMPPEQDMVNDTMNEDDVVLVHRTSSNVGRNNGKICLPKHPVAGMTPLPPCEPGDSSKLIAPPTKKLKTDMATDGDTALTTSVTSAHPSSLSNKTDHMNHRKRETNSSSTSTTTSTPATKQRENGIQNEQISSKSEPRGIKRDAEDTLKQTNNGDSIGTNVGAIDGEVLGGVTNLSIQNKLSPRKKKKRIQPILCGN